MLIALLAILPKVLSAMTVLTMRGPATSAWVDVVLQPMVGFVGNGALCRTSPIQPYGLSGVECCSK